jgi:Big-like domain-containing protein
VAITAPAAAARYDGSATKFSAQVTSPLGDTIPEKDIVWQEVATGSTVELGRGRTITAALPRGVHHLTVTATDDTIAAATTIKQDYTLCDDALCAPRVAISSPADGTHVGMGQSLVVYASVTDPGLEGAPLTKVVWTLNGKQPANAITGDIAYGLTLGTPGTYVLALTATSPLLQYTGSAQITVIVDPPSAPPTVAILAPMDGALYPEVLPQSGQSLQIAASGSANVVSFDWTDTYDLAIHPLASGPTANVTLVITNPANCAITSHVLKVTGTTADGQTATATVTVLLRAPCIK